MSQPATNDPKVATPWRGLLNLADIARTQIGIAEVPRGSNSGAAIRRYQDATNLDGTGWPWCAAFVDWCTGKLIENVEVAGLPLAVRQMAYVDRPRTAAAFGLIAWANGQKGVKVLAPKDAAPVSGDIVVYAFSHCGIVVRGVEHGTFLAVEGNTNDEGARDGYEVAIRERTLKQVKAFIRLPAPPPAATRGGAGSGAARAASLILLCATLLFGAVGCAAPDIALTNGCVIVASNREAVLDARYALHPGFWRRLIFVRYKDRPQLGHCYLYYEVDGQPLAYDEGGTRYLRMRSRDASIIGLQLAGSQLLDAAWIEPAEITPP